VTFAPDQYGLRTLEFVEAINRCKSYDEVKELVFAELKWFGFDFVTLWTIPGPAKEFEDTVLLNSRPEDYIENYQRLNYVDRDPVVTELRRVIAPFSWSDLKATRRLSRDEHRIITEAKDFGADDGLLIPIVSETGEIAVFSPCGLKPDLTSRARSALEIIGIYSQQAVKRLVQTQEKRPNRKILTAREREVIRWVAIGKSDDEIAEILNISHGTVTCHVENLKKKLGAARRTYAVVQALRYGELVL